MEAARGSRGQTQSGDDNAFPSTINTYDASGNLIATEDSESKVTQFADDGLNRPITKILPDGGTVNMSSK